MTTQIDAKPGFPEIVMSREFAAPAALLYRAYTDPDLLVQWLGPRELSMTIDTMDVRDGGAWRFEHHDPHGRTHGFHGVFHSVVPQRSLVRTFEYEGEPGHVSLETAEFEDLGDGRCRVNSRAMFQSVADRDQMINNGMERGVEEGYAQLDELLAKVTVSTS